MSTCSAIRVRERLRQRTEFIRFRAATAWQGRFTALTAVEHVFRWGFVRPWQDPHELLELARIIELRQPKTVLEIGTATGGTLFVWCKLAAPDATIISIDLLADRDLHNPAFGQTTRLRRFKQRGQRLRLVRADSHAPDTWLRIRRILEERRIEFLFLDGDHRYAGVKQDFEVFYPLVAKGGIVAFHDIVAQPAGTYGTVGEEFEVWRYWNEIKGCYTHREIVRDPSAGYGIGILYKWD